MRAVLCKEWGGPEKLVIGDVPAPAIRDGAVRLKIHAAGVNFADLLLIAGQYQEKPAFPFIPGAEAAGVIAEVGAGVSHVKVGDRVMALTGLGAFAEEVVIDAPRALPIPDSMDFAAAAAFPVAYGTSHGALEWRARLQPGEWLLVLGAAGGVGLTAVEIGKAIRERVKAITSGRGGVNVVYDPVGGDAFDASLRSVAWGARVIIIGFASGRVPQIPANIVLVKNIDVVGFYWGSYQTNKPELLRSSFAQLLRWFAEGKLRPHISHRFDLDHVAQAIETLRDRKSTGKVVLNVRS